MPRKTTAGRARADSLTYDQKFNLILGPGYHAEWESEEHRREAWFKHCERLLSELWADGYQVPVPEAMQRYENYNPDPKVETDL